MSSLKIAVIMERRPSPSRWQPVVWEPHAVPSDVAKAGRRLLGLSP